MKFNASVVKLVDAADSKSVAARRAGSIPARGTNNKNIKSKIFQITINYFKDKSMNALLTTLWLILCTGGAYWGGTFVSDQIWVHILFGFLGFLVGLIIRFSPTVIGDVLEGIIQAVT